MSLHPRTYLIMVAGRPAAHLERHGREEEAGQKLVSKGRKLAADCLDNWPDWHTLAILCVERSTRKSLETICWLSTLAARAPSICSPSNISTATCHRSRDEKHLGAGRAKVGRNPRGIHLPSRRAVCHPQLANRRGTRLDIMARREARAARQHCAPPTSQQRHGGEGLARHDPGGEKGQRPPHDVNACSWI